MNTQITVILVILSVFALILLVVFLANRRSAKLEVLARFYGLQYLRPNPFPAAYKDMPLSEFLNGREIKIHTLIPWQSSGPHMDKFNNRLFKAISFLGFSSAARVIVFPDSVAHTSKINILDGALNGHRVEVYDLETALNASYRGGLPTKETFIIIDGEKKNISNRWTGLASIKKIKEILDTL